MSGEKAVKGPAWREGDHPPVATQRKRGEKGGVSRLADRRAKDGETRQDALGV